MIGPLGMINGYYVLFFFVETYYIFAIFDIFFSMKLCKVPMHFKSDILLPSNTFMYDMTWTRWYDVELIENPQFVRHIETIQFIENNTIELYIHL